MKQFLSILTLALIAALAGLSACSADTEQRPSRQVAREADALFATLATMELRAQPEVITRLGLPGGLIGPQENALLGERSQAAFERHRLRRIEVLRYLQAMTLAPEGSALRRDQETVIRTYDNAVRVSQFGHGRVELGNAYPYVADHRSGAWIELPRLIVSSQPVTTRLEAEDYILRLVGLADRIDEERLRLLADGEAGIAPPEAVLVRFAAALDARLARPVAEDPLLTTFENRLPGVPGMGSELRAQLGADAAEIVEARIRPAYERLREAIDTLEQRASDVTGIWALPEGDEYYDALLALHIRPGTNAEALHREGRAMVEELSAQLDSELIALDPLLETTDLAMGGVGERLARLAADPSQSFAQVPDGIALEEHDPRQALLAALTQEIDDAERVMSAWIARQPNLSVIASDVPSGQDGLAARAIYQPPAPDRSRPGVLLVDLADFTDWPRFALPALAWHEAVPGHHVEAVFAMEVARPPLIRQLIWHTGYGEGWASYAETLALEAGLADGEPLTRIGALQSQLFSAARMVVDTGLHRMRWTREEAVDYLVETTGMPRDAMASEVDRMTVWPGQASAYIAGQQQIEAIRARAQAVLGDNFDVAAFHYTLLAGGPRPLTQVEADMERWYEAQMDIN